MSKHITVLIPVYNEEDVLPLLFRRLESLAKKHQAYEFTFLFVNDGSVDHTFSYVKQWSKKNPHVAYVNLSRNFGKEIALIAGLDYADGDATVIIDADLQDPPELIPEMIKYWDQGYDDVYARRRTREGETWLKRATSHLFYRILQRTTHVEIQRDTGDFRLLDRRCVDALKEMREAERYSKGMFSWIGYNKKEITYDRDSRAAGTTKWSYPKLLNLAISGITSFTTAPLRLASILGLVISLVAFIYIVIIVVKATVGGPDVAGYPSLMAVVLFLGGVQLLSLGIIGEYIARIFVETKHRPLYLVEEYHPGAKELTKNN